MTNMDLHNFSMKVQELWNGWELRAMMLVSLSLQIFLIIFGKRRKYIAGFLLRTSVWLAYLSADWFATVSLGILARSQADQNLTPVFWAPILLAHLGGPDTITAYSLEDNELWLRRFLELLTQVSVAFYVLFRLWSTNSPAFVAIPIFVAGIIKYAERIQVLRLASSEKFRISTSKEMSDMDKRYLQLPENTPANFSVRSLNEVLGWSAVTSQAKFLHEAHFLFQMLKSLFAQNFLLYRHHSATFAIVESKNPTDAFKLTEVELGFLYDLLYTKATRICFSRIILRFISFLSFCSALASFFLATNTHAYSKIDITVSYILLVGAFFLEIYSAIMLLFSDWSLLSLSMPGKPTSNFFHRVIFSCQSQLFLSDRKRWSESMAQKDIITDFLGKEANKNFVRKLLGYCNIERREKVSIDLKEHIFHHLLEKRSRYNVHSNTQLNDLTKLRDLLAERGERVLQRQECADKFVETIVDFEFLLSLLIWHIGTTLCFYGEIQRNGNNDANDLHHQNRKRSKSISDYMFYLLIDSPLMLPEGESENWYENTNRGISNAVLHALQGVGRSVMTCNTWDVCNVLNSRPHRGFPTLGCGCELARQLNTLETEDGWTNERKWEMISEVWVEMLTYAAVHGQWKEHAQALTRGGELLTYVRLLMAHLGLSEQCR